MEQKTSIAKNQPSTETTKQGCRIPEEAATKKLFNALLREFGMPRDTRKRDLSALGLMQPPSAKDVGTYTVSVIAGHLESDADAILESENLRSEVQKRLQTVRIDMWDILENESETMQDYFMDAEDDPVPFREASREKFCHPDEESYNQQYPSIEDLLADDSPKPKSGPMQAWRGSPEYRTVTNLLMLIFNCSEEAILERLRGTMPDAE